MKAVYTLGLSALVATLSLNPVTVCAQGGSQASAAVTAPAAIVALTPGKCVQVSPGDIVTLDWNPSFDQPAAVADLQNFRLSFIGPSDSQRMYSNRPVFALELKPPRHFSPPLQSSVVLMPNGFYHMRFEAYLTSVPLGTYTLISAEAVAATTPEYQGPAPRMTNDPTRSPFCLDVVGQTRTGRGALRPPDTGK